jgi:hypothetical protein
MNRREAISRVSMLVGGTIIGADIFLETGCRSKPQDVTSLFNQQQIDLLNEISETILPETKASPGAKAANVGEFMAIIVNDCYELADQTIFLNGMDLLERACKKKFRKGFMKCDPGEKEALLILLDAEQKVYMAKKDDEAPTHYFRMIKELTLLGFFTSEIGATQALRYVAIPGKYIGIVPYKKGDRAWCTYDYFN